MDYGTRSRSEERRYNGRCYYESGRAPVNQAELRGQELRAKDSEESIGEPKRLLRRE